MVKHVPWIAFVMLAVLATGYADQTRRIVIPVKQTDRTSGREMYTSYCAPCHGTDGRGNGAIAGSLQARPTDLTRMEHENNGKFPATHIVSVLKFGAEHNAGQMPNWRHVLGTMSSVYNQQERDLRTANLTRYLKTIQVK